ncbi:MAG: ATP-binding protein [Bacteroidia bacterium]|nr:ATP-binding protein [Bacteroidia bacterium]
MTSDKKPVSLLGFYLLIVYVLLQFTWWSYLMLNLNTEITRLKTETSLLKSNSPVEAEQLGRSLHADLNKKRFMVIGEGTVFFALLLFGIIRVRQTFKKETQLAQQQTNFLLSVTHELKSPIASARLQLETLLLRDIDREKQKEILQNAVVDTDRLNALVENILTAAQIEKNNFILHLKHTDISEYLTQLLSKQGVAPIHKILSDIQPGIIFKIDTTNFASIIINLIDNACKYSAIESQIKIELKEENKKVILSIADEGIGISNDEKINVFEKFYRIGNEETRTSRGTGLGLYIVKHLVEEHGGIISITDNKPKGTIFRIEFRR